MPALPILAKGHAKAQLDNFFAGRLVHACGDKPRLAAALKADMDKWALDLARVPDESDDLPIPIDQNKNVAFLARIKANAAAHDVELGKLQDMMANDVPYGPKFLAKLSKARGLVEADARQWDVQQANYGREVDSYSERNKARHSDYHETLIALKTRLETLRGAYNRSYMFEERLDDDSRTRYFLDANTCIGYLPTQHRWMPNVGVFTAPYTQQVTTGTYIYDFRGNSFQLHIHCNPHDGAVKAIRVKLDAEQHGDYSNRVDINAIIANSFRQKYPPNGNGHWVQV